MRALLRSSTAVLAIVTLTTATVASCGDDSDQGDVDAFCAEMDALIDDDPFQRLPDQANAVDMQRAFETLRERADAIADAAPGEARPLAREWSDSVVALDELLAGSNYIAPADAVTYRQRRDAYEALSGRLENAAAQQCPGITDE